MKPEDSASVLLLKHIFPRKMQINVFNKGAFMEGSLPAKQWDILESVSERKEKKGNSQLSRSVLYANGSKNVKAEYAMTAFNSKWKYEILVVFYRVSQTTQNLVISRCW